MEQIKPRDQLVRGDLALGDRVVFVAKRRPSALLIASVSWPDFNAVAVYEVSHLDHDGDPFLVGDPSGSAWHTAWFERAPSTDIVHVPGQGVTTEGVSMKCATTTENTHAARKARPLFRGCVNYFPDALRLLSEALANQDEYPISHLSEDGILDALTDNEHDWTAEHSYCAVALTMLEELQSHLTGIRDAHGVTHWDGGVLGLFPEALQEVAFVSAEANEQHNPGQPMHWAYGKSMDHEDCLLRHYADHCAGRYVDTDALLHLAKAAWRSLARLQTWYEDCNPDVHAARQVQRERAAHA